MSGLSLSHYDLHWTSTNTSDDRHMSRLSYLCNLLPRLTTYVRIIIITLWLTLDIYFHVWWLMHGLSFSHYDIHLTFTTTFDDICLDYLYHSMSYIWHLLSRLTTYIWIIFITLYLTFDIYYHFWRHMSVLSVSHYGLHLTSTTTFDDICLDYLYHTMAYTWHLLPRLTTYVWIIFITLYLTSDICLDYPYHTITYIYHLLSRLTTSVWIIFITL